MTVRRIVLTLVRYYLPGYKSGGPIRSIANLVDRLGDEFDFRIITSDRDATDAAPYAEVEPDRWSRVGGAQVYYASRASLGPVALTRLIRRTPHDLLYLNSFFDPVFTIQPLIARRLGALTASPVAIAPRGEFSVGSFGLKRRKKNAYLGFARLVGLYRGMVWQASSEYEAAEIEGALGATASELVIAPNVPKRRSESTPNGSSRTPGERLRIIFLARIAREKNLHYALRVLRDVRSPIRFTICGPVRDEGYWAECRVMLAELPEHVEVNVRGGVGAGEVADILARHDLLLLPTSGENYGHVIAESLDVGTPVLISNLTPWRELETAGVGWDLPLAEPERFARCIERCAGLAPEAYEAWRGRVRERAAAWIEDEDVIEANRELFRTGLAVGRAGKKRQEP